MKYEFAHKRPNDWSFEETSIIEQTMELVSNPIAGNPFLMVGKYLATLINTKFLIIGQIDLQTSDKVDTVCFLRHGEQLPDISYALTGTPCDATYKYDVCYYPFGVKEEFPDDTDLVEMNIESYMGTSLFDKDGNKIGLIVLLDEVPIRNPGFIEYILMLVSPVLEQELLLAQEKVMS